MIDRNDVIYAYRLLFGREPENETVVTHYATEVSDLLTLRELFIVHHKVKTTGFSRSALAARICREKGAVAWTTDRTVIRYFIE